MIVWFVGIFYFVFVWCFWFIYLLFSLRKRTFPDLGLGQQMAENSFLPWSLQMWSSIATFCDEAICLFAYLWSVFFFVRLRLLSSINCLLSFYPWNLCPWNLSCFSRKNGSKTGIYLPSDFPSLEPRRSHIPKIPQKHCIGEEFEGMLIDTEVNL